MRDSGRKSIIFGIFGFLFLVVGVILIIAGNSITNNFQEQILYFYEHGDMDPTGAKIMYGGIGALAVSAICFIVSFILLIRSRRQFSGTVHDQDYEEFDDMVAQLAGNRTIFDVFHSEDEGKMFSFYRNKTCILKDGEKVYRGKMEPLTWEAGHPTLWRITMDIDGTNKVCEISKVEGDILVKSDEGEEIFYRN